MSWFDPEVHEDWFDTEVLVCTDHKRFIPCRKYGDHTYSSKIEDVKAVRDYMADWKKEQDESSH